MPVPFLDVTIRDDETRAQILSAITDLVNKSAFVGGEHEERNGQSSKSCKDHR